jgi:dolichol kinase
MVWSTSASRAAEPLLWAVCLAVSMTRALLLQRENATEALLCLVMLGVATCRATFLLASWPWTAKVEVWRLPNSTHSTSDPPGLCMSLLMVPLVCLAIGNEVADSHQHNIWYFYALFVSLCSCLAWEDSLWRHTCTMQGWKGLINKALLVLVLGNVALRLSYMTLAQGHATTTFVLVILWHGMYHSIHDFLPKSFHGVFTQGEWLVVTSLVAVALAHYFKTLITSHDNCHWPPHMTSTPNHATVAISGLISAALTCPIMTMISGWWRAPTLQTWTANTNNGNQQQGPANHDEILSLLLQLPLWVGIPLAGVELLAFKSVLWLPPPSLVQQSSTYLEEWGLQVLLPATDRAPDNPVATMTSLAVFLEQRNIKVPSGCIPQAIHWLFQYLVETEESLLVTTTLLPQMPRYGWLVYWVMILALALFFSPEPPSLLVDNDSSDNNNVPGISKTHAIVLARKWFHGIAVLLFAPVTLAAPQLLSLSYAIALAILMLLESARYAFPMIQQFHQRYLDPSKDAANGLVISHMALILGCALPLWISELLNVVTDSTTSAQRVLLQLWGVLSLGIGDAMGAIVGVLFGRTCWSRDNSRTLEGSMSMWVSLLLSCGWVYWYCGACNLASFSWRSTVTVTLVTLLEAHTSQIDNLVLPLTGAALLLMLQCSSCAS